MTKDEEIAQLRAELAAIRAAGGEQVEVVAEVVSKYGDPEAFGERELVRCKPLCNVPYKTELMTVAQHDRIVAAMAAELERAKRDVDYVEENLAAAHDERMQLRADLEAARRQEPVAWRVLFLSDGEWIDEGRPWVSGMPDADTLSYFSDPVRSEKWKFEYAYPGAALPPLAGEIGDSDD